MRPPTEKIAWFSSIFPPPDIWRLIKDPFLLNHNKQIQGNTNVLNWVVIPFRNWFAGVTTLIFESILKLWLGIFSVTEKLWTQLWTLIKTLPVPFENIFSNFDLSSVSLPTQHFTALHPTINSQNTGQWYILKDLLFLTYLDQDTKLTQVFSSTTVVEGKHLLQPKLG